MHPILIFLAPILVPFFMCFFIILTSGIDTLNYCIEKVAGVGVSALILIPIHFVGTYMLQKDMGTILIGIYGVYMVIGIIIGRIYKSKVKNEETGGGLDG